MKSLGRFAAAGESPTPVAGTSPTSRPMKAAAKKERTKAKSKSTRLRDSYTWRHKEEKTVSKRGQMLLPPQNLQKPPPPTTTTTKQQQKQKVPLE
jgi:hypothetical protein